ncbi:MAG: hypothetical protein YHS30scaffold324_34 [Catenulispora phage 69_17]|jgi:hypothetical protein|nr:MAG: hypothetical protein YHS30scaffold324_34 [Catenulispora phage 69_17]
MSTATANGTPLRDLTAPERKAVELRGRGATDAAIRVETGLTDQQIAAAVDRHATWQKLRGNTPPAEPEQRYTVTAVLRWAEASGLTRALTLAARVREQLAELRGLQEQTDARAKAQADVDKLTAELEAAKARLREAGGKQAAPTTRRTHGAVPDPARKERLDAIRAWAPGAGFEISPLGRIPRHVEVAFDAAHGGAQ